MRAGMLILILFCVSCGDSRRTPIGGHIGKGAASPLNAQSIKTLNEALSELNQAQRLAFTPAATTALPPEQKIEGLRKALVQDEACAHAPLADLDGPGARDYTHDWQYEWYVDDAVGKSCPLRFHNERLYNHGLHALTISQNLQVHDDLRTFSGIWNMESRGTLAVVSKVADNRRVTGSFTSTLHGEGLPANGALVQFSVEHQDQGLTNSGSLNISVQIGNSKGLAKIAWSNRFADQYTYNGAAIDRKTFNEMFSAFRFAEFIDNAKEM